MKDAFSKVKDQEIVNHQNMKVKEKNKKQKN